MYKIKSFLMAIVLLICSISSVAFAEEELSFPMMKDFNIEIIEIDNSYSFITSFTLPRKSIEEHIFDECKKHSEQISLEGYYVTIDELSALISANSDFMIYAGGFPAAVYVDTGYVAYFFPRYLFDNTEDDEQARKLIDERIKYYVDYAKNKSDDSLERLLLAHDKLIHDVYYDFEFDALSFHAYGMLANGKGVCQGYSEIIYMIAKEFGIEAWFCNSKSNGEADVNGETQIVGHIWNYIKLDGEWYHLDATWNDPDSSENLARLYNSSSHSYFMVSDEKMEDHKTEYEWIITLDKKPVCDNKKYETNHIFNFKHLSNITYENGDFFATLDVQEPYNSIVFKSCDGLYTGPIITSEVSQTNSDYIVYYYFLENFDKFDVFVGVKDGEKLLSYGHTPKGSYPQFSMGGERISKTTFPQKQGLSMFIWDLDTLRPLSKKVELN